MSVNRKNQRTILVSFSGVDGAGKSTQIANLCAYLRDIGLRVQLITFWDDVASLKRMREEAGYKLFKGDKGVGTPEAPIHRRDKNVRSPWMTPVRLVIYVFDAISLRRTAKTAMRSDADVVIFDRYLYDELANLNLHNTSVQLYLRGILKLVPRPEVSFVFDVDPAQARARKPEYPLEFLCSNRDSYLKLTQLTPGITVIPPMSLEEVKAEVIGCVLRKVVARDPRSDDSDDEKLSHAKTQSARQSAGPIAS